MKHKNYTSLALVIVIFIVVEISILNNLHREKFTLKQKETLKFQTLSQAQLEDLIKKSPLDPEGYYLLSINFSKTKGGEKEAEALLKRAFELDPFSLKYNFALAEFYKKNGNDDESLKLYLRLLANPSTLGGNIASDIYCDIAELYLNKDDRTSFNKYIDKAKEISKNNWKIDFLLTTDFLSQGNLKVAFDHLEKSYENFNSALQRDPTMEGFFRKELNKTIKENLKKQEWNKVRLIYDRFSTISGQAEDILIDLAERFKEAPELINKIWGDRIYITLLNPDLLDKPVLLDRNEGCRRESLKHFIESGEKAFETIEVNYSYSPGYVDLWHLPLKIPIKSDRTSARIVMKSDVEILDRQIAVEILGNLYYSRGVSKHEEGDRYFLLAKNIMEYVINDLLLKPKDYNIFLTKLGFNTICRNGKYSFESFEIYLED